MKKFKFILLILSVGGLGLTLYGCSNKYNMPVHSVKYYYNNPSQMRKMIDKCKVPNTQIKLKKFASTNYGKDCINAYSAAQEMY